LRTWLEYFPQAFVYGLDISISREGDRYRIFKADQSNRAELRRIVDKELKHPLFLIVDDGSHVPEHQVACFDFLFGSSALLPGGTYIVEDVETSYWTRGGLYGYTTRFVVIFHNHYSLYLHVEFVISGMATTTSAARWRCSRTCWTM
jgi:hypothetical protein